jgi:hypothetical protein
MTDEEFLRTARLTEDTVQHTVDVRPFGDGQSGAVEFCLYQMYRSLKEGTLRTNGRPIVVSYSHGTDITTATFDHLKNLHSFGVPVNLKEADSGSSLHQ